MMTKTRKNSVLSVIRLGRSWPLAALVGLLAGCASMATDPTPTPTPSMASAATAAMGSIGPDTEASVKVQSADGVDVYGYEARSAAPKDRPLILLFHQGGSNGRAEYAPLVPWLSAAGYDAIIWDQRSGGERYGSSNQTKDNLPVEGSPAAPVGYCDAYPDLQAAVTYVRDQQIAEQIIVWGSSYSGALVFQLAANNPDMISGVIAFSPASGDPLKDCLARDWVSQIDAPMFMVSPASEMAHDRTQEQSTILQAAGASLIVVEHGIHGSSMLIDARTDHDMSGARSQIIDWLDSIE